MTSLEQKAREWFVNERMCKGAEVRDDVKRNMLRLTEVEKMGELLAAFAKSLQAEGNGEGLPVEGEDVPVATLDDLQALRVRVYENGYDWGGLEDSPDEHGDYVPWYAIEQLMNTK